jgi:hypothetical protein
LKSNNRGVYRTTSSGVAEERIYSFDNPPLLPVGILAFPNGEDLLIVTAQRAQRAARGRDDLQLHRLNIAANQMVEMGPLSHTVTDVFLATDLVWGEPGRKLFFNRTANGITNLWAYDLVDKALTQLTFGPGPDLEPMPYPDGKGILFVNGKGSGFLSAYHFSTKTSVDIVSENATQPVVSSDGKRLMYIKIPDQNKMELWISDIDGNNPLKIASSRRLSTLDWSRDGSQFAFADYTRGHGGETFLAGADGQGLHKIEGLEGFVGFLTWAADDKTLYISSSTSDGKRPVWVANADGSHAQKFLNDCCLVADASADGKRLLSIIPTGNDVGIYQITLKDKKLAPLLPGVTTFGAHYSPDGKSVVYPVTSRGEITFYRQVIQDEKPLGKPQAALKLPFTFPLFYQGNAFDFSRDLSTIVYARPGGQADFYLLSQK